MRRFYKLENKSNFVFEMGRQLCLTIFTLLLCASTAFSQASGEAFFHSAGKIYVVLGVVLIVFLGMVLFLISIQRKVSKLEKQIDHERSEQ